MHHQNIWRGGSPRHRREILQGVERRLGVKARIDHEARARHKYGVAVWRGTCGLRDTDIAAGPSVVFDIKLLLQAFRQLVCNQPRHYVGGTAGRERYDYFHRMIWVTGC
jgi:hypothetical protein